MGGRKERQKGGREERFLNYKKDLP